jgi:MacB-like periplasmic core domain
MFKNYLKTSLRFLARNKGFTLINVAGLSIGTFCCLYIHLYVRDQFSYDRGFSRSGAMYRVVSQVGVTRSGSPRMQATTTPPVGPALAADFVESLSSTRIVPTIGSDQHLLLYKDKEVTEKNAYLVDPNFFDLFDFHFSAGSADQALDVPNGIVLSKEVADKLFEKDSTGKAIEDPLGKMVLIQNGCGDIVYKVTGVIDESIDKSSIQAGIFFRMDPENFHWLWDNSWVNHNIVYTFIRLKPGVEASEVERKLPDFLARHTGVPGGQSGIGPALHLQPIHDIHTSGEYEGEMGKTNYQSLHDQISPFMLIYKLNRFDFNHLIVKARSSNYASLLHNMQLLWKRRVFMAPFEYSFLSEDVKKMYETEFIMSRIISSFTLFAILISCLGLFGLAAFSAEQRTKEIGIRKIMGASVLRIVRLLSSDFFTLICLAFLVAVPITWWIMNRWLNVFAYRIEISWWMFALSGGAAMIIAMAVVTYQAVKAAVINPVKSLRAD